MHVNTVITFLCLLSFISSSAFACRGPMFESQTFLQNVPSHATEKSVVAKVRVIFTTQDSETHQRISLVRVKEAIKGTQERSYFVVQSEMHSCSRDYDIKAKDEYYIAGGFNDQHIFEGLWYDAGNSRQPNDQKLDPN